MPIKVSKPQYKKITELFSKLCGRFQLWELWEDAMIMFSCSISNSVDKRYFDEREERYISYANKYTKDEMHIFVQILAEICNQLEVDPNQDFLGDLYMTLNLGSHWHGQFFTPYNVCKLMAESEVPDVALEDVKPITCLDPACGGGALLIATGNTIKNRISKYGLSAQEYVCFFAQDLSQTTAMMCYIQLSLLGFAAKVKVGDSLLHPMTNEDNGSDIWYTPMWFSDVWVVRRMIEGLKI